jgi:hypothetical protein
MSAYQGVRIADFTQGVAGPMACMLLGDFEAEVVKIEPAGGDRLKDHPGYPAWNRNKRVVTLDLSDPSDLEKARGLARAGPSWATPKRPKVAAAKRWASSKRRGPLSSRPLARPAAAMQRPGAPSQRNRKPSAAPALNRGSTNRGSRGARGRARLNTPSGSSRLAASVATASSSLNVRGACTKAWRMGRG